MWLALFCGLIGYVFLRRKLHRGTSRKVSAIPIAHSSHLTELPAYRRLLERYMKIVGLTIVALSIAIIFGVILSARPARVSFVTPVQQSRDIMLCLDVSGSVLRVDSILVNRFKALVANFSGQRVGITVFNSSAVAILPLSDDYQLVNEQLTRIGTALQVQEGQEFTDLTSGTLAAFDKGTSLVSDGLATCMNYLGENSLGRSQSIILATDNEANGEPIITSEQAIDLAKRQQVRIYAIDPGPTEDARKADHDELSHLANATGGGYYKIDDAKAVAAIIDDIAEQEAKYTTALPVVSKNDSFAALAVLMSMLSVASVALLWRLKV